MKTIIVLLGISILGLTTQAEPLSEMYLRRTQAVLRELKKQNITQMACQRSPNQGWKGCSTPDQLLESLNSVSFIELPDFKKPDGATRWTAFYDPQGKRVLLNQSSAHDEEMAGFVGLHELLGVLGKDDSQYRISMASYLLLDAKSDRSSSPVYIERLVHNIKDNNQGTKRVEGANNVLLLSGGGTIVGGGGDFRSFKIRAQVFSYLLKLLQQSPHSLIPILFPMIDLKVSDNEKSISYVNLNSDSVHVLVSKELVFLAPEKDLRAPNRAVENIGFYLASYVYWFTPYSVWWADPGHVFFFPKDLSQLHPNVVKNYWLPEWKTNCEQNQCKLWK